MSQAKRSKSRPRKIGAEKAQAPLGLTIDPRRLSRAAILELMRIAAGLSYKDVSRLTGIPRAKVIRLIRGAYVKPRVAQINQIRELLWAKLPAASVTLPAGEVPNLFTLKEAAELAAVRPEVMRRLVVRGRVPRAIKIGRQIRISQDALASFISASEPAPRPRSQNGILPKDLAQILRVTEAVIRYGLEMGRIRAARRGRRYPIHIPRREVSRLLREGTHRLELPSGERPRKARKR